MYFQFGMCYNVKKCRIGEYDMRKVGLTVYGLSFINGEEKLELHDIYDGKSLLDIVEKFAIENKNNVSNDPENESIFLFEKVERKEIISTEGKEEYELLFGLESMVLNPNCWILQMVIYTSEKKIKQICYHLDFV